LTTWGSYGSGNGQFNSPIGVAVDGVGNVYVADYGNHRIQKFDSAGNYLGQWGSYNTGLNHPSDVDVDDAGNIYVVDSENHRIQKFDNNGTYLTSWGGYGSGEGQFKNPGGVAVDSAGHVYIADIGNNRIQKFVDSATVLNDNESVTYTLEPGTYNIREAPSEGWAVSDITCTGGSPQVGTDSVKVTLMSNDDVTCTFTNYSPNLPPVAVDDTYNVDEDRTLVVDIPGVLENDTDADHDTLTTVALTEPAFGTLLFSSDGSFIYTPVANYNGPDSFTYQANDGMENSNVATVFITVNPVNDSPVAVDQSVTTNEDTAVAITLESTDIDSSELTFAVVAGPTHGTLSGHAPDLVYHPAADYFGFDSFTFKANDGVDDSSIGTVSITIYPVNDPPVAEDQSVTTNEDGSVTITLTATDVEADLLTYVVVTAPAHGMLSGDPPELVYIPAADYNGPDSFTFQAYDGAAYSSLATVSITVTPVNDPPVANDDTAATDEDMPVIIDALTNDSDVDVDDTLTIISVSDPPNGVATTDGEFVTYTPDPDFNTPEGEYDSFTYTIRDSHDATATATVRVTVGALNDPPVAVDDLAETFEDVALVISVLVNDIDVDGDLDTGSVSVIVPPLKGTAVGLGDGTILYSPDPDYNGPDSFTYEVCDSYPVCAVATVRVTIVPVNDPPLALDQEITTNEDAALAITLIATDVDLDSLTYSIVINPAHGTFTGIVPDLVYTPDADYNGTDSFTFQVSDGTTVSNIATVAITVTPVNDLPVVTWNQWPANPATFSMAVTAAVTFSDVDLDDSHTCTWDWGDGTVQGPTPCSAGIVSGSHDYSSVGNYIVSFVVADNAGAAVTITVPVTVIWPFTGFLPPVDNPPTLNSIKAGSAVPAKFSLGGDYGLNILTTGYPKSVGITCNTGVPIDEIEETVTAGSSSLQYDPLADQYTYVWKTDKAWANTCRQFQLKLIDGTTHVANFKFK
jgi:VCBS repeat-containing protein